MTNHSMEVGTTSGGEERESRSLSAPLLRFALSEEATRLRGERPYADGDRNARTLAKVSWFRLTLVALRSGATFKEADQRGSVALQVLQGRIIVEVGDEAVETGEAEVAVVAPGHPWVALAVAESLLLVHLAWPPEPASATT
jgi:quercetin dioxygenase-like cupin family protein